jgi:hypothetical protein
MIVDMLGIIEDGSPRAPTTPTTAGSQLQFAAGEDVTVRLRVITPAGVPGDTTSTYTLTIKKRSTDGVAVASVVGVAAPLSGSGHLEFDITSQMTKLQPPGRYVFDVWRDDGSTKQPVVPLLPLLLRPRGLLP